ncbi:helix-turn-helix transcriptional regulator [Halorhodospira sp. 9621]|uniref:helix-turn-helix transcriptional regulator n=1 Tax=Halorhodospira sp. 9621 TaxID=2899135 RepID=UPI003FCD98E1
MSEPKILYIEDLERGLGASRDAIRGMVRRGELPRPAKLGRRLVWRKEEIEHWLDMKFGPVAESRVANRRPG